MTTKTFTLIIVIAVAMILGAIGSRRQSRQNAQPTTTASTQPVSSFDFRAGETAGRDFGYYWAEGAGHPLPAVMPVIARRQWEAVGRSYSPQTWQDGWVVGFEEGFNRRKSGR